MILGQADCLDTHSFIQRRSRKPEEKQGPVREVSRLAEFGVLARVGAGRWASERRSVQVAAYVVDGSTMQWSVAFRPHGSGKPDVRLQCPGWSRSVDVWDDGAGTLLMKRLAARLCGLTRRQRPPVSSSPARVLRYLGSGSGPMPPKRSCGGDLPPPRTSPGVKRSMRGAHYAVSSMQWSVASDAANHRPAEGRRTAPERTVLDRLRRPGLASPSAAARERAP